MTVDQSVHIELVTAAATGRAAEVAAALGRGADIHYEDDLAFRAAVFTGHGAVARFLIEQGADIHAAGEEALFYAAKRGDLDMVGLLLGQGAVIEQMIKARPRDITPECLAALQAPDSAKRSDAFKSNFERVKKIDPVQKFRLKGAPPSP